MTFHIKQPRIYDFDGPMDSLDQFQISKDGRFSFVVEDYPYKEIISFDLELISSKYVSNEKSMKSKWIVNDSVYYISHNDSIYSVNYLNFSTNISETIIEFDELYPSKIVVTDNYIIIFDTSAVGNNFLSGNYLFPVLISSLFIMLLIKKSITRAGFH